MFTNLERYYSLAVALIGLLGTLLRIAYLMGSLLTEFHKHITDSQSTHADVETRLRQLEHARRR